MHRYKRKYGVEYNMSVALVLFYEVFMYLDLYKYALHCPCLLFCFLSVKRLLIVVPVCLDVHDPGNVASPLNNLTSQLTSQYWQQPHWLQMFVSKCISFEKKGKRKKNYWGVRLEACFLQLVLRYSCKGKSAESTFRRPASLNVREQHARLQEIQPWFSLSHGWGVPNFSWQSRDNWLHDSCGVSEDIITGFVTGWDRSVHSAGSHGSVDAHGKSVRCAALEIMHTLWSHTNRTRPSLWCLWWGSSAENYTQNTVFTRGDKCTGGKYWLDAALKRINLKWL